MLLESDKSNLYNLPILNSIPPAGSVCPLPCVNESKYLVLITAESVVLYANVADAFDVPPEIVSPSVK